GVLLGRVRAHRGRGDRKRRQRVPPAAVGERCTDAARARDGGHLAVPRRLVARRAHARASEQQRVGAVPDRARSLPGGRGDVVPLLGRPDLHVLRPRARGQHLVSGLPAALGAARARPLRAAAVHEPRRPARVLERRGVPDGPRARPDRRLPRERQLADPPVRRRRLHRVHALAGGDGAVLESHQGAWLVIVAIPTLVLLFLGVNRHYRRFARRLEVGMSAVQLAGRPTNQVLLWVESIDVATEGALWYARQISRGVPVRALLAPGRHTDPGIRPRWWD